MIFKFIPHLQEQYYDTKFLDSKKWTWRIYCVC